jgi:hypothetical protein
VKKILFITLAVILALGVSLVGCTAPAEEEEEEEEEGPAPSSKIVIAASVSLTDTSGQSLDVIHSLAKGPIVDLYLSANPTITVGGSTYDVEVHYIDDTGVLNTMLENTDTIIDGIHAGTYQFLLGPTCTAYLEAQAPKCTSGEVVQMTVEGGATSLFPALKTYKYSFINLSFSNWFEIPVLAKMLAEAHEAAYPGDTPVAVIGFQNDDHGLEYLGEAEKYFGKEGIDVADKMPMTGADPCATLVAKAKAAKSGAGADILCVFGYTDWTFTIHAKCIAQSYDPKALILGPGGNFGAYTLSPPAAGACAEGVISFATANSKTAGNAGAVIQQLEAAYTMFGTDYWGHPCYWTALDFIYAGAAAEGSDNDGAGFTIDQTEFRSYVASTKLDSAFGESWYVTPHHALSATQYSWSNADLVWPVPSDSAGLLNYKCHTGEIGQWQNGYFEVVGYSGIGEPGDEYQLDNYDVTAPFVYPKPAWGTCGG